MAHAVDIHVGRRLRHCRWVADLTQAQLAQKLGVSFQQIQKYEAGVNRISASRLWELAQILQVPVALFFSDIDGARTTPEERAAGTESDEQARELVRCYYAIAPAHRHRLLALAAALRS